MKLPSGAGAISLAALAGQFVDVTLDHRPSPESNFQRLFQVLQVLPKGLAQAAELVELPFGLHLLILYYIQITGKQAENTEAVERLFQQLCRDGGLIRGYGCAVLLSELQ
jgi:hypothetical protein